MSAQRANAQPKLPPLPPGYSWSTAEANAGVRACHLQPIACRGIRCMAWQAYPGLSHAGLEVGHCGQLYPDGWPPGIASLRALADPPRQSTDRAKPAEVDAASDPDGIFRIFGDALPAPASRR